MTELLGNAWLGWQGLIEGGKVMALFLASLLFLWTGRRASGQRGLLIYSTVMAVCCILPVTAAVLMLYQTKFYDYIWIWSLTPVTVVTAWGATVLLADCWPGFSAYGWRKGLPVAAGILLTVLLCSGMGSDIASRKETKEEYAKAAGVLEQLTARGQESGLCLWAPREIMEYARSVDGGIRLPYGRNMWDISLNAYSYDVYPDAVDEMYKWMSSLGEDVQERDSGISAGSCIQTARQQGVNCILLPEDTEQSLLNEVKELLQVQPEQISGYYAFFLPYRKLCRQAHVF